jgi:hypothetical protein
VRGASLEEAFLALTAAQGDGRGSGAPAQDAARDQERNQEVSA